MLGVEPLIPTWEQKLLVSVLVGLVAVALAYIVRRQRPLLARYTSPIVADLVASVAYIGIVIGTTLVVADIWGQTETLLDQMGVLRLDARTPQMVITLVVLVAVQVFVGIAKRLLTDLSTESQALTKHQREVGVRVTQLTLWLVGIVVILGVWDVDLTGLLVGAGFLGIVIGLASRKTLGSLLAGFVLMFSRPFEVGDWVKVAEHEGVVSDITMMSTRIRAFNGDYVVVPNDVVSSETVVNRTRRDRLRVAVEVGVDYDADVDHARAIAQETAATLVAESPHGLESPEPDVLNRGLGDSAVVLEVRLWLERPTSGQVNRVKDTLLSDLKERFESEGIKIPYPQRELSGRAEEGGFQLSDAPRRDDRIASSADEEQEGGAAQEAESGENESAETPAEEGTARKD